jgi:serine/threonine protein kinase
LHSINKDDFDREVEMLKKFSGDAHPHLVSLLATYVYFDEFYLIFHWAEADLLQYWKRVNPNPNFNYATVSWMIAQCKGIADGLSKIHRYESEPKSRTDSDLADPRHKPVRSQNHKGTGSGPLYGRHGDIKPENILWFSNEQEGILQITDFGLAELNSRNSRSHKAGSQVAISATYRPPECDLPDCVISRSYDIWTLGCLYLEFITWLLGGQKLLFEFAKRRKGHVPWSPDLQEENFFEKEFCKISGRAIRATVKPKVLTVRTDLLLYTLY